MLKNSTSRNICFKALIFICLFFGLTNTLLASSSFYFESSSKNMAPGSEFVLSVYIDSLEEINAIDLELHYPKEDLELLDFNNAGTIVDVWQLSPDVSQVGTIKLSGGILQGFKGEKGLVLKLYFKSLRTGTPDISFARAEAYLADGLGTRANVNTLPITLSVENKEPKIDLQEEMVELAKDETPPEMILSVVRNPEDGKRLVVFNIKDEESGVATVEMRYKKWFSFSDWQFVVNPALYPKRAWMIELKVTNHAGLENTQAQKTPIKIWGRFLAFLTLFSFLAILSFSLYNKHKRERKI